MKSLTFCFLLYFNMSLASDTPLITLRRLYYDSSKSSAAANQFLNTIKKFDVNSNPILLCYKGMAYMLQAKHSFNPYRKLSHFNTGRTFLEAAVKSDPLNVEIRFMRFCIQTNAPFFLDYKNNTNEDKNVILNNWSYLKDVDLKNKIREYMLESTYCNANEKAELR